MLLWFSTSHDQIHPLHQRSTGEEQDSESIEGNGPALPSRPSNGTQHLIARRTKEAHVREHQPPMLFNPKLGVSQNQHASASSSEYNDSRCSLPILPLLVRGCLFDRRSKLQACFNPLISQLTSISDDIKAVPLSTTCGRARWRLQLRRTRRVPRASKTPFSTELC